MKGLNSVIEKKKLDVSLPVVIKSLENLLQAHYIDDVSGGDLLVDNKGNKFVVLVQDRKWNDYAHLVVNSRNGRVCAMSELHFPITWEK